MFIEFNLREHFAELWPTQFVSLAKTNDENRKVLNDKQIQRLTPRKIYRANTAMNCAYALFIDWLTSGKTDYSSDYKSSSEYKTGIGLFQAWLKSNQKYVAGDEYHLVNEFARVLNLQDWYSFKEDDPNQEAYSPTGPTNPELLKEKEPATTMYCLSALEKFDNMTDEEVRNVGFEIAMLGTNGIDYASSDRKYSLRSLPGAQFSGLQLLAYMYVAFNRIDPSLNTGVDFRQPYELAMKMFRKQGS
jgi:hypothetical protein